MSVAPAVNVLVIFQSVSGVTEKLALAAAVGAVQERANVRIRRLPNEHCADDSGEQHETAARMRREYVSPSPADALWADAVVVAMRGKICGLAFEPGDASAYCRQMVAKTRHFKHRG